jgi:hypothetical protein
MRENDPLTKFQALPEEKYARIDLDHLLMYAVGQLNGIGADLSFENIIVAVYKLFPRKFSLVGYPEYPDAKRAHKCLRRCTYKTRRWLGGKERQGFTLTDKSLIIIQKARSMLALASTVVAGPISRTRRKERILTELESSVAYLKAVRGDVDSISEGDYCFMLQGTLDTSGETLRANLDALQMCASEQGRLDILRVVKTIEKRFTAFLAGKR